MNYDFEIKIVHYKKLVERKKVLEKSKIATQVLTSQSKSA